MLSAVGLEVRHGDFLDNGCDLILFEDMSKEFLLVGDVKVSWKFSQWRTETTRSLQNEYRQVVSQLHHYIADGELRYGFIVTDKEFIMLKRGAVFGKMEQGDPVEWHVKL